MDPESATQPLLSNVAAVPGVQRLVRVLCRHLQKNVLRRGHSCLPALSQPSSVTSIKPWLFSQGRGCRRREGQCGRPPPPQARRVPNHCFLLPWPPGSSPSCLLTWVNKGTNNRNGALVGILSAHLSLLLEINCLPWKLGRISAGRYVQVRCWVIRLWVRLVGREGHAYSGLCELGAEGSPDGHLG